MKDFIKWLDYEWKEDNYYDHFIRWSFLSGALLILVVVVYYSFKYLIFYTSSIDIAAIIFGLFLVSPAIATYLIKRKMK